MVANIVNGLEVVILQILPARERIELLLEFLRREARARLSDDSLYPSFASGLLLEFLLGYKCIPRDLGLDGFQNRAVGSWYSRSPDWQSRNPDITYPLPSGVQLPIEGMPD